MVIHGMQKMTLVDFPGLVAAILFSGGCNFRCPFCQNAALVLHPDTEPRIPDEEIFGYLAKRRKMIEGVVLTGGEPTLQKDLLQYAERIRSLGLRTKLDTNGYRPDVLKEAVREGLFDYVAMDIKNSVPRYGATVGIEGFDPAPVLESIAFLLEGHVDFEFRTTVMAELHDDDSFRDIAGLVEGVPRYFLQAYSDSGDIIDPVFSTPAQEDMERYLSILAPHVGQASIRDR